MIALSVLAACGVEYGTPADGASQAPSGPIAGSDRMGRDTPRAPRPDPY